MEVSSFRAMVDAAMLRTDPPIRSESELARRLGMTQQALSMKLNGRRGLTPEDVAAIGRAIGLRPYDLLVVLHPALADEGVEA